MKSDPGRGSPAGNGVILGIGSVLSMALATTIAKIALREVTSIAFTALWATIGGALAIGLLHLDGHSSQIRKRLQGSWRTLIAITLLSSLAQTSYFVAVDLTHPALVVFLGRMDLVVAALLGVLVLKEEIVFWEIIGSILALVGVAVMSFVGEGLPLTALLFGMTSAIGAAFSLLLGKVAVANVDPLALTAATRTGAGLILLSLGISTAQLTMPTNLTLWLIIILAAILGPFLSFLLLYKALFATQLFRIAIVRSLMPFAVVIFSFVLLSSIPSLTQLGGGAITTIGIILVAHGDHQNTVSNKPKKELIP